MSTDTKKVIFVGESGVGKSSIIRRIVENIFDENQKPTLGFQSKSLKMEYDGNMYNLMFWDTAGQEKFHSLVPAYFRGTDVAILVYDVTEHVTLEKLRKWNDDLTNNGIVGKNIIIVGSKIDLQKRNVETSEGKNYADEIGASFIEVSALDGDNIDQLKALIIENAIQSHNSANDKSLIEKQDKTGCNC